MVQQARACPAQGFFSALLVWSIRLHWQEFGFDGGQNTHFKDDHEFRRGIRAWRGWNKAIAKDHRAFHVGPRAHGSGLHEEDLIARIHESFGALMVFLLSGELVGKERVYSKSNLLHAAIR